MGKKRRRLDGITERSRVLEHLLAALGLGVLVAEVHGQSCAHEDDGNLATAVRTNER